MPYSPLSIVKDRISVGEPLPFNVHGADRSLLLAKGDVMSTQDQLLTLFRRGALIDLADLHRPEDRIRRAAAADLPRFWAESLDKLAETLRRCGEAHVADTVVDQSPPVVALVERDKDLAVFQVMREIARIDADFGIQRAIRTAITACLVAQRLGWNRSESELAFKAALTMDVSMLELLGQFARQAKPPTPAQRAAIFAHPEFSRRILEFSGVTDRAWLTAVAQHHECADGSGYPHGIRDIDLVATLIRRADTYVSKLSPRTGRPALSATAAGQTMFLQYPGDPMVTALVKEFGYYPPGSYVRLASGEIGTVLRRGPTVTTPMVAVLISAAGHEQSEPVRRETRHADYAITGTVPFLAPRSCTPPAALMTASA